nr:hypothetical protein [Leifsonia xyli]
MAVSWATWSATSTNTGDSWNVSTFCTAPTPLPATGSTRIALNLRGTAAIAGGQNFSLALASDGTAWAWGYNGYGQLRNGTTTDSITPVRVQRLGGRTITAIAAGAYYSLAFASDGTVWAWGGQQHRPARQWHHHQFQRPGAGAGVAPRCEYQSDGGGGGWSCGYGHCDGCVFYSDGVVYDACWFGGCCGCCGHHADGFWWGWSDVDI